MRRVTFLGVVWTLAWIVAACAPAPTAATIPTQPATVPVPVTGNTPQPAVAITEAPTESPTEASTSAAPAGSPTPQATETTTGPDSRIRISTSTRTGVSAPFLVDQTGRTLYLFTGDTQSDNTSSCIEECLTTWPAVVVTGVPTAGTGIDPSLLGTITREDGTMQATYNGWPLYYYSSDRAAGSMTGQGIDNSWFMVSATGNAIQK